MHATIFKMEIDTMFRSLKNFAAVGMMLCLGAIDALAQGAKTA